MRPEPLKSVSHPRGLAGNHAFPWPSFQLVVSLTELLPVSLQGGNQGRGESVRRSPSARQGISFPAPPLLSNPKSPAPQLPGSICLCRQFLGPWASCPGLLQRSFSNLRKPWEGSMFIPEVKALLLQCLCAPMGSVALREPVCFTWQAPLSPLSSLAHSAFSISCGNRSKHCSLLMSFIRAFCSTWDAGTATVNQQVRKERLTKLEEQYRLVRVKPQLETSPWDCVWLNL